MEYQGRVVLDQRASAVLLDQLWKIVLNCSCPRLFDSLCKTHAHLFACCVRGEVLHHAFLVDSVVPDIERLHERIVGHLLPVGSHGCAGRTYRIVLTQTEVTPGDDYAYGKALEVPFPRRG